MKVEIRDLSEVKKEMSIEVPADRVERAFDQAVRRVGRKVSIPGFRKGKAPAEVIRQRYAREVGEQVERDLAPAAITEVFEERSIEPLGSPVVDAGAPASGEAYRFTVRYEVRPTIGVRDYLGQKVARPSVEVADEDVQEELRKMQEAAAFLLPVEGRGAEDGDAALVDLTGKDPTTGETLKHEGVSLRVGQEGNLPAFDEALRGRRAGDELEFDVPYPEDFSNESLRGKTVHYTLRLRELKRQEVPALDDEFARDAGDFADLAALRDKVRERLGALREAEADRVAKDRLLTKIADQHDFEVPEAMVEHQLEHRMQELAFAMASQGVDLRREDIKWDRIREDEREKARGFVKRVLLLDEIARRENLSVTTEELDERIARTARIRGEKPAVFRNKLKKEGDLKAFENQALREKCLDFIHRAAKIIT
jgi:trigger factor